MRILFITATRIGDAVISTGLLDHLIERHPEAKITVACGPLVASLFSAMPQLERIIELDKKRLGLHWLALWSDVRHHRWDLVVDLRRSLISYLVPTKDRAVLGSDDHRSHRVALLSTLFNIDPPRSPKIWISPAHEKAAAEHLPSGRPFIAVAPIAARPEKTWPQDRFGDLVDQLIGTDGPFSRHAVLIVGAEEDRQTLTPFANRFPEETRAMLIGCSDLPVVAAVLQSAAVTIANDSGVAHLAAAATSPTVTLFGPTQPELYAPTGPNVLIVQAQTPFPGRQMSDISVEQVFAAVESFLK